MYASTYLHGSFESPYLYGLEPDMIGHISFLASAQGRLHMKRAGGAKFICRALQISGADPGIFERRGRNVVGPIDRRRRS